MSSDAIARFEALLEKGRDSAMLRFGLGTAYHGAGDLARAEEHLVVAVDLDPGYSAAWKAYGRILAEAGRTEDARDAYDRGIAAAEAKGDIQAAKEMRVFRKRLG